MNLFSHIKITFGEINNEAMNDMYSRFIILTDPNSLSKEERLKFLRELFFELGRREIVKFTYNGQIFEYLIPIFKRYGLIISSQSTMLQRILGASDYFDKLRGKNVLPEEMREFFYHIHELVEKYSDEIEAIPYPILPDIIEYNIKLHSYKLSYWITIPSGAKSISMSAMESNKYNILFTLKGNEKTCSFNFEPTKTRVPFDDIQLYHTLDLRLLEPLDSTTTLNIRFAK
ncbi:MAG: hypothetical protein IPP32_05375 [Bacteroidetes bacterium]|nr:hypothetical protein [Bacteroidota bacterium]